MKIKFFALFLVMLFIPLFACNNLSEQRSSVSQIRYNIFYGEENGIKIKVFSEEKEYPFINDGIANSRQNFVIVKVLNQYNDTNINLSYNGQNYNAKCQYNAHSNSMDYSFKVKSLPNKEVTVVANTNDTSVSITCKSLLKSDTISPLTALEKVNKAQSEFISTLYQNGEFKAEIYVRLIVESDYNFYYVGFGQGANKITAFLIDGITGEILAGKN